MYSRVKQCNLYPELENVLFCRIITYLIVCGKVHVTAGSLQPKYKKYKKIIKIKGLYNI